MPMFRFTYEDLTTDFEAENLDQAYQQFVKSDEHHLFLKYLLLLNNRGTPSSTVTDTVKCLMKLDCNVKGIYGTFRKYPDFIIKAFFEAVATYDEVTIGPIEEKPEPAYEVIHINDTNHSTFYNLDCKIAFPGDGFTDDFRIVFDEKTRNVIAVVTPKRKTINPTPAVEEFCKKYQFYITEKTAKPSLTLTPIIHSNVSNTVFGTGAFIERDYVPRRFVVKTIGDKCRLIGVVNIDGRKMSIEEHDIKRAKEHGIQHYTYVESAGDQRFIKEFTNDLNFASDIVNEIVRSQSLEFDNAHPSPTIPPSSTKASSPGIGASEMKSGESYVEFAGDRRFVIKKIDDDNVVIDLVDSNGKSIYFTSDDIARAQRLGLKLHREIKDDQTASPSQSREFLFDDPAKVLLELVNRSKNHRCAEIKAGIRTTTLNRYVEKEGDRRLVFILLHTMQSGNYCIKDLIAFGIDNGSGSLVAMNSDDIARVKQMGIDYDREFIFTVNRLKPELLSDTRFKE